MRYILITLVLCFSSSALYAQQDTYYLGLGIGKSDIGDGARSGLDDGSFATLQEDESDLYYELIVGGRLNQHLSIELAHQVLGDFSTRGISDGSAIHSAGNVSNKLTISLNKLSLQMKLIGSERFSSYMRLGVQQSKTEQRVSAYSSSSHDGNGLLYGLGMGFIATSDWLLQLEATRYSDIAYQDITSSKEQQLVINTLGVRTLYLF